MTKLQDIEQNFANLDEELDDFKVYLKENPLALALKDIDTALSDAEVRDDDEFFPATATHKIISYHLWGHNGNAVKLMKNLLYHLVNYDHICLTPDGADVKASNCPGVAEKVNEILNLEYEKGLMKDLVGIREILVCFL